MESNNISDVKSENVNMKSVESEDSNLEEEEEDELIDLDMEVNEDPIFPVEETKIEEITVAKSPVVTQHILSTEQNTEQNKKKTATKGNFFSPKNNKTIGKLFINSTSNLITEENMQTEGNVRTDQASKTVLSKVEFI
jgi:hypothetical protein